MIRIATSYGQVRPEMATGCPERIDPEFLRYVWTFRREQRPRLLQFFAGLRADQVLVCFVNRGQGDRYLDNLGAAGRATNP